MKSIVDSQIIVNKFWDTSKKNGICFRLMRYVVSIIYEGKTLLHNVVTGQLVELDSIENSILEGLPKEYSPEMNSLIDSYFIVPVDFDEHKKVQGIKVLLRALDDMNQSNGINNYTILPTTACNARCYYCFEKGIVPVTMNEQIAKDVVRFIINHLCDKEKVFINWFGGEPTIASVRINQICNGLQEAGVNFRSSITTNGYLLNEQLIKEAKNNWNLENIQISVDGTESTYNQVKDYVNAKDNPFQRVMDNIGIAIDHGINVDLRMNYGFNNYKEFSDLLDIALSRYKNNPLLGVRAHQINDYKFTGDSGLSQMDAVWFNEKNFELNELSRQKGLYRRKKRLPSLDFKWCYAASSNHVVVLPQGELANCPERFGEDQIIGNLKDGITCLDRVVEWKRFADFEKCAICEFFPSCTRVAKCHAKDKCLVKLERYQRCKEAIFWYAKRKTN